TETYDLIDAGLLAPLDEYLTEEDYEKYIYLDQGAYNSEGQLCTFPMMAGNPCVIFYNMDMLEAAGIT
ncbi:MAG TPA: extracellular solute-binding protein, partial [Candidatus Scatomorpha stercorigallinarum]|nr:extracellular solute-binding protein [Candidatus Scatomorpha stercorigallinarum]